MNRWIQFILICSACSVAACWATGSPSDTDQADADSALAFVVESDSLGVPLVPDVRNGQFRIRANHMLPKYRVDQPLPAVALRCADPASIQILATGDAIGLAILVALPTDGDPATTYDVEAKLRGIPAPGTARVGMQLFPSAQVSVMPGAAGTVVIAALGVTVSGTVNAVVRESSFLDSIPVVAAFRELTVRDTSGAACSFVTDGGGR